MPRHKQHKQRLVKNTKGHVIAQVSGVQTTIFRDIYHHWMVSNWPIAIMAVTLYYLAINCVFAAFYLLDPDCISNARPGSYSDAFFFSVQTLLTVGYGNMTPHNLYGNILTVIEAWTGVVSTAVVTGLIFTKFSRPTSRVLFSQKAVVTSRDGKPCLMFRLANERGNHIAEAHIRVALVRDEMTIEGEEVRRFYELKLTRDYNLLFFLTWTVVHTIDEESPLYGHNHDSLRAQEMQIVISLNGHDSTFAQSIYTRHSYSAEDVVFGARFKDILSRSVNGIRQIDYQFFHDIEEDS